MNTKDVKLDGLRGIAALAVVTSHFVFAFYPFYLHGNYPDMFNPAPTTLYYTISQLPFLNIFYNGTFAVMIFFVLSGYVLTLPYYNHDISPLKKRLLTRYFRLNIPIVVITVISFIILSNNLYYNKDASQLSGSLQWLGVFFDHHISWIECLNISLFGVIINGNWYLDPPLWSISIELIGSSILLVFFMYMPSNKYILLFTIVILLFLIYAIFGYNCLYYYALFAGAYLKKIRRFNTMTITVMGMMGIYLGGFVYGSDLYPYLSDVQVDQFNIYDLNILYSFIGAIVFVYSVINNFLSRFFTSKISLFLGKISYSIYLIHFIVLNSIVCYLYSMFPHSVAFVFLIFFIYLSLVVFISWVFYHTIDKPSIVISHHLYEKIVLRSR